MKSQENVSSSGDVYQTAEENDARKADYVVYQINLLWRINLKKNPPKK